MTLYMRDFAGSNVINTDVMPANYIINSALQTASERGHDLLLEPGVYRIESPINVPSNVTFRGVRGLTTLAHAPGMNDVILNQAQSHHSTVEGLILDGKVGVTEGGHCNNADTDGYVGAEWALGGKGNIARDMTIIRWNNVGCSLDGDDQTLIRCAAIAIDRPSSSYKPDPSRDLGGSYGFLASGYAVVNNLRMIDCQVRYTRGPGIFVGGKNGALIRPYVTQCHRGLLPDDPAHNNISGGGQIALSLTSLGGGVPSNAKPTKFLIDSPYADVSDGPYAYGVELQDCWAVTVRTPFIQGVYAGLTVRDSRMCRIEGGVIGATRLVGLKALNATYLNVSTSFEWCNTAVELSGACENIDLRGSSYYANAVQLTNMSSATVLHP